MPSGIRATVRFTSASVCPIVELSSTAETTIDSVSTNVCSTECTESVTEFSIDSVTVSDDAFEQIFSDSVIDRYRLRHDEGVNCPCECLGRAGCPVTRYVAQNGTLTLVFYAATYDQLTDIVDDLRTKFPDVEIRRFVRSSTGPHSGDSVTLDRNKLTARQLEVLQKAYEKGYFERPRQANATEIAAELEITASTFREHLAAAESKILRDYL